MSIGAVIGQLIDVAITVFTYLVIFGTGVSVGAIGTLASVGIASGLTRRMRTKVMSVVKANNYTNMAFKMLMRYMADEEPVPTTVPVPEQFNPFVSIFKVNENELRQRSPPTVIPTELRQHPVQSPTTVPSPTELRQRSPPTTIPSPTHDDSDEEGVMI